MPIQFAPAEMNAQILDNDEKIQIQSVVGTFICYGCAVEPTVLTALHDMATMQAKTTISMLKQPTILMDYLVTYPNTKLHFYVGNMQQHLESGAAYLLMPEAKSRIAAYFYLHSTPHAKKCYPKGYNAPIHVKCSTLKKFVSSAAEAECGGIFHNCTTAIGIRDTLHWNVTSTR